MLSLTVLIAATPIKELKSEEKVAYIHSIDVVCYQYSAPQESPQTAFVNYLLNYFKIHKGHQHAICIFYQIYYTYIFNEV